jgi:N-acetyl-alpha-D-muramate 1-phosphate uridylyltransferase
VSLPVAVLAGGLATRLRPLTEDVPKILIEIDGRPFAEHQLDLLQRWGVSEVVYCLGYRGEQVMAALGDGADRHMRFTYVSDGPRLAGTGGALRLALPFLGDAFFVMYGDSYLRCDFRDVERAFRASGKPGLMTVFRNEGRWDRSNVAYERGRIIRYDKASAGEQDASSESMRYIDYGLGILTPEALAPWAGADSPFDLSLVYQHLIDGDALAGLEVAERFYEIGSLAGIEETRALLARQGSQGSRGSQGSPGSQGRKA